MSSKCQCDEFMKDFDNGNKNKILKITNFICYYALIFGKVQIIYSLIKHCFYFPRKNKLITITFVLQWADKKLNLSNTKKTMTIKWITVIVPNIDLLQSYDSQRNTWF